MEATPKRRTKARILESATALFAREGYHGVGLRKLCAEAGVTLQTVFYHYGSKRALYRACLEYAEERQETSEAARVLVEREQFERRAKERLAAAA